MQGPDVSNIVRDEKNDVTYNVLAYRQLSREEALQMVHFYLVNTPKRKRPKKHSRVTIMTVIGANE